MNPTNHDRIKHLVCSVLDAKRSAQPDVLYFVIAADNGERYVPERPLARMTREATIRDLRARQFGDEVVSIIETEITADGQLSSRNVTANLLMEADIARGLAPDPVDRQAAEFDHNQDHRKNWSE
jgi:hypothetical protein